MSPQDLRYPACPTCGRPLYPHARGGICCLGCKAFVKVSTAVLEQARAAAHHDGFAPLDARGLEGEPRVDPPSGQPCPTCRSRRGPVAEYQGPKCVCGAPLSHPAPLRRRGSR